MFTTTISDTARAAAKTITESTKKDFDHLPLEELKDRLDNFANLLTNKQPGLATRLTLATLEKKSVMAREAREVADTVVTLASEEASARWQATEKIKILPRLVAQLESAKESCREYAAEMAEGVEFWHWESRTEDFVTERARVEVLASFIGWIESMCWDLSLTQAIEHAAYKMMEEMVSEARSGMSRSTSQMRNLANDAKQQARAKAIEELRWSGLKPTRHETPKTTTN